MDNYKILVSPKSSLVDEKVQIKILGKPLPRVTLKSYMEDQRGRKWESKATFCMDEDILDISSVTPVEGSYNVKEPMGFIWSMNMVDDTGNKTFDPLKPIKLNLELSFNGKTIAKEEIHRLFVSGDVSILRIKGNFYGKLFKKPHQKKAPAVLVLSGAQGGFRWSENVAALLASRGIPAMAVAYINEEDLPPYLTQIPLEYFKNAIQWLKTVKGIDEARIGVVGISRGGELALLLGAVFNEDIKTVVSYSGSGIVFHGISWDVLPSWTYRGKSLEYLSYHPLKDLILKGESPPYNLSLLYEEYIKSSQNIENVEIPVEKIKGAVLLISGEDDKVWPSTYLSNRVIHRLKRHCFTYPHIHISYKNAGHGLGYPYVPTTPKSFKIPVGNKRVKILLGGTPYGNAKAREDSWEKMIAFLKEHL